MAPRTQEQRVADSQQLLRTGGDAWLATAADDTPHLVIFSMAWDETVGELIFCTEADNRTARNVGTGSAHTRIGLGDTRDVLMLVGEMRISGDVKSDSALAELFSAATGWDPRGDSGEWVFLRFSPTRGLAWRGPDEIDGRVVMREGKWL